MRPRPDSREPSAGRCFDARIESPLKTFAGLAALLLVPAAALLFAATSQEEPPPPADRVTAAEIVAATPRIAHHVERIRELRFEEIPRPRVIDTEQLTRKFRREARRTGAVAELREGEVLLKMLGLIEPDEDLSGFLGAVASDVAGAYDPRTDELYVIEDAIPAEQAVVEVTIAHELTHALEDQAFGLREGEDLTDDRGLAFEALVEGSATAVMVQFAAERNLLGDLLLSDPGTSDIDRIPEALQAQLVFPYLAGQEFVQELRRAGADWDLVDVALRERPPVSTEQILHPNRYLSGEEPESFRLGASPGGRWRRLDAGDVGEFDLRQLILVGSDGAAAGEIAGGWSGGRFAIWRRGPAAGCEAACRERHAVLLEVRFDAGVAAPRMASALGDYFDALGAEDVALDADGGLALLPGGAAAAAAGQRSFRLAFAPSPALAARLASGRQPLDPVEGPAAQLVGRRGGDLDQRLLP